MSRSGASKRILLSHYVYHPVAIEQSISDFQAHCAVTAKQMEHATEIEIAATVESEADIVGEFLNYTLGLSAQYLLAEK